LFIVRSFGFIFGGLVRPVGTDSARWFRGLSKT
jgi:hypothetical protein